MTLLQVDLFHRMACLFLKHLWQFKKLLKQPKELCEEEEIVYTL